MIKIKDFTDVSIKTNTEGNIYADIAIPSTLKNVKITKAKLKLVINNVVNEDEEILVNYECVKNSATEPRWENVEHLTNLMNTNTVYIDFTDELQDAYSIGASNLHLVFLKGNSAISFNEIDSSNLDVECFSLNEFQSNASFQNIDCGKAGQGSINLATGEFSLNHLDIATDDNVLPLKITHNYNSSAKDISYFFNDENFNTNCGKGWNLNVQQYLKKVHSTNTDEEYNQDSTLCFEYIDSTGKTQLIEERYYYLDDEQKKHYVDRKDIEVDLDGNYTYNKGSVATPEYVEIKTELQAQSGLKMVSSIEDIKGSKLIDYEPEELINIRTSLKSLKENKEEIERNIESNYNQSIALAMSKIVLEKQLNNLDATYPLEEENLDLQSKIEHINALSKTYSRAVDINNYYLVSPNYRFDKNKINDLNTIATNNSAQLVQDADTQKYVNILSNESAYIYSLGLNYDGQTGSVKIQKLNHAVQSEIYFETMTESEFLSEIKNQLLDITLTDEKITSFYNKFKTEDSTFTLSLKDKITIDLQIEALLKSNERLALDLEDYEMQITKLEHQRELYEMQVPVHYLYNEDNIIYGFGKTANEDIFRLILVSDPYENSIFINYASPESNQITSIIDSAEKSITFNYDSQLRLSSIIDARDREISFAYINDLLSTITYPDKTVSRYFYDSDNKMIAIIDQSNMGAYLEYSDNQIKVQALSTLNSIKHNQPDYQNDIDSTNLSSYLIDNSYLTIQFYDCKTTYVKNAKGKTVVYVFNNQGQAINIYEDHSSLDFDTTNVLSRQYTYTDKLLSESITTLPYARNYLDGSCFDTSIISLSPALFTGNIIVSEYAYSIPSFIKTASCVHSFTGDSQSASISMSELNLSELNTKLTSNKIENMVLTGWAKANSAFVKNPNLVDKFNDEEISYPSYINNRKFELRISIKYSDETDPQILSKQFDWMNTEWQYCSLPIKLKPKQIESISCYFDYSNNTNTANVQFTDLDLREGSCESRHYDDEGKLIRSDSSTSFTLYTYDSDGNLLSETTRLIHDEDNREFTTTYEYNKNNKLLKTIDYNGIVTENVYNDKGVVTKTLTYHVSEPTRKFYSETPTDEKGKTTSSVNEFGEPLSTNEYIDGTGIISTETDSHNNRTSYAYDSNDTLIGLTSTVNGEENTNIYGYTLTFLTSLKHNDFEYNYEYDNLGKISRISIAGNEYLSKTYAYQDNDSIEYDSETTTYKNGATFKQILNDDGNVTTLEYNGTTVLENIYNSLGNVIQSTDMSNDENNIHKYYYDKFGNLYRETNTQHNTNVEFENTLNPDTNQLDESTIRLGNDTYTYNYSYTNKLDSTISNLSLSKITGSDSSTAQSTPIFESDISYDRLGRTSEIKLSDHIKQYHYLSNGDHTSNLISSVWYGDNLKLNENYRYRYDEKGNILEIRENGTLISRYKYDSLSRLIREDNKLFNKTTTYDYDAGGNITLKTEYSFTLTDDLSDKTSTNIYPYLYKSTGWRDQLLSYNGETFVYDSIGNPTTYRSKTLSWSHARQLDTFDTHTYKYNANGIRIQKDNIKFFLNGNKIISQTDGTDTLFFYYGTDGITGFNHNGTDYFYKKNIQGDIIGIYDNTNILICKYIYDAWGNHVCRILSNNGEYIDNSDNETYNYICNINPFRYRGYYYDTETGLYYLNSRYYDSELGRFINADSINNMNINSLNGINLYIYCSNNPIKFTDTEGSNWFTDLWNKTKSFFKRSWDIILGSILSIGLVVGGIALTIFTAGSFANIGSLMIGAGLGGFIGGLQSKLDGYSYWGGYVGGFVSGGFAAGFGAFLGPIGAFVGGALGNFTGNIITDSINGKVIDSDYWLKIFADSLISGLISMGGYYFGELSKILNVPNLREIFAAITVWSEFATSYMFEVTKDIFQDIIFYVRKKTWFLY